MPSWCPAVAPKQLSSAAPAIEKATEGKCCFNGCGDEGSCVTGYCASRELCLKPQPDGGCDSSPPYGQGAMPSWCPAVAPKQLLSATPAIENATEGKCCFNGCGDEGSCVTGYFGASGEFACWVQSVRFCDVCMKGTCSSCPTYRIA
ncbi:unnamed protein product [Prorocentrum cordatum]|uniref:Uncharacterized protein n=1 Tax=Prorocentrum cordatum TaxID=2364126 RepID=A0ABN9XUM4_9DINO|nr:unnamed protein product [Polarella glacialis]